MFSHQTNRKVCSNY